MENRHVDQLRRFIQNGKQTLPKPSIEDISEYLKQTRLFSLGLHLRDADRW